MALTSPINHGLEIGRRALAAHQAALNTTSHNIANANTPGFSRRSANLETSVDAGFGSGVDVGSIVRQRSRFLDAQVRVSQQVLGRWEAMERSMQSVEVVFNEPAGAGSSETGTIFNEPSGMGLSGSLSRFWNAWQDLANVPESGAARAAVRQEGIFLTETLHQYNAQLLDIHRELDNEIVEEVENINSVLDQLAAINREIPRANFDGGTPADLQDQRDKLLEELSYRVDISVVERDNGQISVLLSGHNLVETDKATHLNVRRLSRDGSPVANLSFADDGSLATVREGRIKVFPHGIPGFERHKEYGLVVVDEEDPFLRLLSIEEPSLGFVIVNPMLIWSDYNPEITKEDLDSLEIESADELEMYCLVTLSKVAQDVTVNLKGPICINTRTMRGKQMILVDDRHQTKHSILEANTAAS